MPLFEPAMIVSSPLAPYVGTPKERGNNFVGCLVIEPT